MSRTLYRSLSQLEVWQPYTIVQCSEKRDGNILLYLRGNKEEEDFMSLLLLPYSAYSKTNKEQNVILHTSDFQKPSIL